MTRAIIAAALAALVTTACDRAEQQRPAESETEGDRETPQEEAESPIAPRPQKKLPPPPVNKRPPPFKLSASHVLIQYKGASRAKVERSKTEAESLAQQILAKAKAGDDFATLAREHSDGPTKGAGGYLNAFEPAKMVPEFSKALEKVAPGEVVPEVVETQFGFHVIRREPLLHVGHVLIEHTKARRAHAEVTRSQEKAQQEIREIRELLAKEGADWATIARERSDCRLTKEVGGDLGYYGKRARLLPEMMKASNDLQPGELSEVFETDYGYHVMWRYPNGAGQGAQPASAPGGEALPQGEAAPAADDDA